MVVPPPPVIGLGTLGGFKLQVEDRADCRRGGAVSRRCQDALGKANQDPALGGCFSTYQINVPQLDVDVDRVKVKRENVKLSDVFETLQVYLGSLYVNDFNRFGRTYQVVAQADAPFRSQLEDILPLKTRNAAGDMVPLGSVITCRAVVRTGHRAALQRLPVRRHQRRARARATAPARRRRRWRKILDETLPRGMSYEWTDLAYQQLDLRQHRRSWSSRCACCSCSWCWPRSTRA